MSASAALRREEDVVVEHVHREAEIVALKKAETTPVWRQPADMPKSVYKIALACWVAFLSLFWITFLSSGNATFMLVICAFYAFMFFSVPVVLVRLFPERMPDRRDLASFLHGKFETIDGTVSGFDALIQVIVVPACLTVGGVFISYAIMAARAAH